MKNKEKKMRIIGLVIIFGGLMLPVSTNLQAQTVDTTGKVEADKTVDTELVYRQQYLKKQFTNLTRMMIEVADLLAESEPASARAIRQAVNQSQQAFIDDDMDKVVTYLNKGLTTLAGTAQAGVVEELKKVLRALQSSPLSAEAERKRIEQLDAFLQNVKELRGREIKHQHDSHLAAEGRKLAGELRELGKKLDALIKRQVKMHDETGKLPSAGKKIEQLAKARRDIRKLIEDQDALNKGCAKATPGKLMVASENQKDLKARADKLADKLGKLAKGDGAAGKAVKSASASTRSAGEQMKTAAGKLAATNSPAAEPHQKQALADLKKAEKALTKAIDKLGAKSKAAGLGKQQKQLGGQTSELSKAVKAVEAKAGMGSKSKSGKSGESGCSKSNLDKAAGNMKKASGSLGEQNKSSAGKSQKKALEQMRKELKRLKALAKKLEDAAKNADLARQKRAQDATGKQADKTAENMKKPDQNGKPAPGQKAVASAAESMKQASGSLGQGKASAASGKQGQAVKQLEEAAKQLQRELDKAREANQEETLVQIEQMLRDALKRQKVITESTTRTHRERKDKEYDRTQVLKLADLSDGEGKLGKKVNTALVMIRDEGTTAVFPMVLDEVQADLTNVQGLLARKKAGPLTQSVQKGIEKNLEELVNALQKEVRRRKKKGGSGAGKGGGGGGKKPPLVPPVAELKMLRSLQKQINKQTLVLNAEKSGGETSSVDLKLQHKITAKRQSRLVKTTIQLNEKIKSHSRGGARPKPKAKAPEWKKGEGS